MQPYRLYGTEISYFTGKVRAYLRWKDLPFVEIPSDASVYSEVILPRVGFPVVPVVVTPQDETLQDTTDIIEALEQRHPDPTIVPGTPVQRLVAALLELYGDEWLVIPAMHYRWHHNREWAQQAFGQVSAPDAPPETQREIGASRAAPFARAAERLGATPPMHEAVEASYEALLGELQAHFDAHDYVLGSRPSMADFGLIGPLYAHLYRDPKSGELMRRKAPALARWVERMQDPQHKGTGEYLPNDRVPPTLLAVLTRMMREQLPVLVDTATQLRRWLAEHPGERIRRKIGTHTFELQGRRGERMVMPYSLWMLQRARDAYVQLEGPARIDADALLAAVGGEVFSNFPDPPRLAREGMSVRLATS
ncbi:MAG: glutathione S-transferase N-terminal domain-containing protein [Myxococcales bacterium]|nr:glutathione S-transferase N-terminal domain-containing protein [Myxococcales bacterium]